MYTVTGITGQVGGRVARTLLERGAEVRAVVRDAGRGAAWSKRGCEVTCAEMSNASALLEAFAGAEGVFVLMPPIFDPEPGFPEARAVIDAVCRAIKAARPERVVCLSTIGAQAEPENLLTQLGLMERGLGELPMPVTFLRPAWYMENCRWDVDSAQGRGVIDSFLHPLDRAIPMVGTADVGRLAAELLLEHRASTRVVELEGPRRVSPLDIARAFSVVLGREVRPRVVPRERWEDHFRSLGMRHPASRIRMLDGFNEGWIAFEDALDRTRKGVVQLDDVVRDLVAEARPSAATS